MKKYFFLIAIVSALIVGNLSQADVMNPDYLIKKCPTNKIEKVCSFRSATPFGPETWSDCGQYRNNPLCTFLVGHGSSFGGQSKYCCQVDFNNISFSSLFIYIIKNTFPLLLLTLLLELPIFWIFGFRNKRAVSFIILANLISVISFSVASFWLGGFIFVVFSEVIIIIFEIAFLKLFLKEFIVKKIIFATLVANIISATVGTILLSYISRF